MSKPSIGVVRPRHMSYSVFFQRYHAPHLREHQSALILSGVRPEGGPVRSRTIGENLGHPYTPIHPRSQAKVARPCIMTSPTRASTQVAFEPPGRKGRVPLHCATSPFKPSDTAASPQSQGEIADSGIPTGQTHKGDRALIRVQSHRYLTRFRAAPQDGGRPFADHSIFSSFVGRGRRKEWRLAYCVPDRYFPSRDLAWKPSARVDRAPVQL